MAWTRWIAGTIKVLLLGAMMLLVAPLPRPALAVGDCSDPAYVSAFGARVAGSHCVEVARFPIRWRGGVATLRILRTDDAPEAASWIRDAVGPIAAAMDQMGGLRLHDTTIMLTNLSQPIIRGEARWANVVGARPSSDQCLMTIYLRGAPLDPALSKFSLARELFHCMQLATWPHAPMAGVGEAFWVEGSAEYFANLAFPATHYCDTLVADFVDRALTTSLLDFSRQNVVFFSWLGGRGGAPAVKTFIDRVSPGHGRSAFRPLAEAALSPDAWDDFATSFVGNEVHLPGSAGPIGADWSRLPRHSTAEATEFELRAEPLVLVGAVLKFTPAAKFRVQTVGSALASRYGATRDLDTMPWQRFPETVDLPCNQEWDFFIAAISPTVVGTQFTIVAKVVGEPRKCTTCAADAPAAQRDRCVVGTWHYRGPASFCAEFASNLRRGEADVVSCTVPEGDVTFAADGTVTSVLRGAHIVVRAQGSLTMDIRHDLARSTARWATERGTMTFCNGVTTVTGTRRFGGGPTASVTPVNSHFESLSGRATYTCTARALNLEGDPAGKYFLGLARRAEMRK